jgi:hypothetical protein
MEGNGWRGMERDGKGDGKGWTSRCALFSRGFCKTGTPNTEHITAMTAVRGRASTVVASADVLVLVRLMARAREEA